MESGCSPALVREHERRISRVEVNQSNLGVQLRELNKTVKWMCGILIVLQFSKEVGLIDLLKGMFL